MAQWNTKLFEVKDLLLDTLNPRIPGKDNTTQEEIIDLLLKQGDVLELANGLVSSIKLTPIETIVVLEEGKNKVIVEGNRRTCAAKLLSDPALIPEDYISKFPKLTPSERNQFRKIEGFITKDRDESLGFIARRHLEIGTKRWSTVAQHRIVKRLLDRGWDLKRIRTQFHISNVAFDRLMIEFSIMREAKEVDGLTEEEKNILDSESLKHAPLTYFMRGKKVGNLLKLKVDNQGRLNSSIPKSELKCLISNLSKGILLNESNGISTRTPPEEIVERFIRKSGSFDEFIKKWNSGRGDGSGGKGPNAPQRFHFFRHLEVPTECKDSVLRKVSFELHKMDYYLLETAACALVRIFLERTLVYAITCSGQYSEYKNWAHHNQGNDFAGVIRFIIENDQKIFSDSRQVHFVRQIETAKTTFLDKVLHGSQLGNKFQVEDLAKKVRPFVEKILKKSNLKVQS